MKAQIVIIYYDNKSEHTLSSSFNLNKNEIDLIKKQKKLPEKYYNHFLSFNINEAGLEQIIVNFENETLYCDNTVDEIRKHYRNPREVIIE